MTFRDAVEQLRRQAQVDPLAAGRLFFDNLIKLGAFVRINNLYRIQNKNGRLIPFRMNKEQIRYYRECGKEHFVNILKSRQEGFTTLKCIEEYDAMIFNGDSCGIQAHVLPNVQEIFQQKVKVIHECFLKDWSDIIPLVLEGDSRIEIRIKEIGYDPPISRNCFIRVAHDFKGITLQRLHQSEAAFMGDIRIAEADQCVPYNGYISKETTPNGMGGLFYRSYQEAKAGRGKYKRFFAPFFLFYPEEDDPVKDEDFKLPYTANESELKRIALKHNVELTDRVLQWRRNKIAELGGNEQEFERLYPSDEDKCFYSGEDQIFPAYLIDGLVKRTRMPRIGEIVDKGGILKFEECDGGRFYLWNEPKAEVPYAVGMDTSEGVGRDPTCAYAKNRNSGTIDGCLFGQLEIDEAAECALRLCKYFNYAHICPEENNHGHAVIEHLKRSGWTKFYKKRIIEHVVGAQPTKAIGFRTDKESKIRIIQNLKSALRNGTCRPFDPQLIPELTNFICDKNGRYGAKSGEHDDRIMALALTEEMDAALPPAQEVDLRVEDIEYDPLTGFPI